MIISNHSHMFASMGSFPLKGACQCACLFFFGCHGHQTVPFLQSVITWYVPGPSTGCPMNYPTLPIGVHWARLGGCWYAVCLQDSLHKLALEAPSEGCRMIEATTNSLGSLSSNFRLKKLLAKSTWFEDLVCGCVLE